MLDVCWRLLLLIIGLNLLIQFHLDSIANQVSYMSRISKNHAATENLPQVYGDKGENPSNLPSSSLLRLTKRFIMVT